ncbi:helix-turn-helix transcriptional regulator [Halomarina litorea]|uniref:helix-turn-helix transcriptional regulator n=1 Tax=Halomarina litorea TaxID=2961595 RepID=UPI0020C2D9F6|nr:GntR family transcriptional regulator [Halomarina sp. BCD28]
MSRREGATAGVEETIDLLVRRHEFVRCLRERPLEKRAMTDELGVSRSTVDRAMRELETAGIVEFVDGAYAVAPFGEVVAEAYARLEETIDVSWRLEPIYRWVSPEDFDVDPRLLADADVYVPRPGDPYAPINRHVETIREMDTYRGVIPATGQHATEAGGEAVLENGARAELVVTHDVAATQRSSGYADTMGKMIESERFRLLVTPRGTHVPYAVHVFDEEVVQIIVHDSDEPRAMLESDSPAAREWAEETYREYREVAEPIEF